MFGRAGVVCHDFAHADHAVLLLLLSLMRAV
jgi:hypothetical protein